VQACRLLLRPAHVRAAEVGIARRLLKARPSFDEFLFLRFRASNQPPYSFEWLDLKATSLDYGAILTGSRESIIDAFECPRREKKRTRLETVRPIRIDKVCRYNKMRAQIVFNFGPCVMSPEAGVT